MISLHKWFVPGRHNNYHPSVLRPAGLALCVALLLFVNLSYNLTSVSHKSQVLGYATSISPDQIIALTNQQRANQGLSGLATNSQLTQAAQAKAQDMFAKDYWSHYSPDGTGPWYFITNAGYNYATAGENLAKDFNTSEGVVSGWMGSPAHRDNILNTSYRDIGVAAVNGTLQGSQTTVVVAMYASPQAAAAPPAPAAPASAPPSQAAAAPAGGRSSTSPSSTSAGDSPENTPANPAEETPPPPPAEANKTTTPANVPSASKTVAGHSTASTTPAAQKVELEAVRVREDRNWAQNASLFIVSALFLMNIMKHTVVWRVQRRGWRHIWLRAHPLAQYGLLVVAICANLAAGVGVIR